jgi:hypothetical protein
MSSDKPTDDLGEIVGVTEAFRGMNEEKRRIIEAMNREEERRFIDGPIKYRIVTEDGERKTIRMEPTPCPVEERHAEPPTEKQLALLRRFKVPERRMPLTKAAAHAMIRSKLYYHKLDRQAQQRRKKYRVLPRPPTSRDS